MKCLLPLISIPVLIFCARAVFPAQSGGAPSLSLSAGEKSIIVGRPFSIELTISWEGDAEGYLVETPRLKLPQGIIQSGSSFSTSAKGKMYFLRYRYSLCATTTGSYALEPVAINYWGKDVGDARTARTEELHFRVGSWREAALKRYWIAGGVLLIFISLFSMLFVLSTKKKRTGAGVFPVRENKP